ncbi:MAG: hypothetical protein WD185_09290 [Sneathiella sp.]
MTIDDPIKNLIAAAEKMDKWLFQTCRSSRFRRLVSHGLPAQELHDALDSIHGLMGQTEFIDPMIEDYPDLDEIDRGTEIPGSIIKNITDQIDAAIKEIRSADVVNLGKVHSIQISFPHCNEDDDE